MGIPITAETRTFRKINMEKLKINLRAIDRKILEITKKYQETNNWFR